MQLNPTKGQSAARSGATALFIVYLAAPLLTACGQEKSSGIPNFGGDEHRGAALIGQYGCGQCHEIPNIAGAQGNVGPPLHRIGTRAYIAGVLSNSPENLTLWLQNPQKIVPGNAMPNMGISPEDSRDIAAFLYTLK